MKNKIMNRSDFLEIAVGAVALGVVIGCGGGAKTNNDKLTNDGSLRMHIQWPDDQSRFVHYAANEIRVKVVDDSDDKSVYTVAILKKPQQELFLSRLPYDRPVRILVETYAKSTDITALALGVEVRTLTRGMRQQSLSVSLATRMVNIVIPLSDRTFKAGESKFINVSAYDAEGALIPLHATDFDWEITDPSKFTLNTDGSITASPNVTGSTTLRLTERGAGGGGYAAEFELVGQTKIDHLDILPANPTVAVGKAIALTASPKDKDGNPVSGNFQYQWLSSDTSVATVDPISGNLTGAKIGNAQITVTQPESGKSASVSVEVTGVDLTGTWIGSRTWNTPAVCVRTESMTVDFVQNGTSVTGTIRGFPPGHAELSGSVTPEGKLTMASTYSQFVADASNTAISGSFQGPSCGISGQTLQLITGPFSLTRAGRALPPTVVLDASTYAGPCRELKLGVY